MGRTVEHIDLKTLHTIMSDLGHRWIDVLKIDIEGSEWRALEGLLTLPGTLPFTQLQVMHHHCMMLCCSIRHEGLDAAQLCAYAMTRLLPVQVEYHVLPAPNPNDKEHFSVHVPAREGLRIMRSLQDRGLRPFNVEPNLWCGAHVYPCH